MPHLSRATAWLLAGILAFTFALGVIPFFISKLPPLHEGTKVDFPPSVRHVYLSEPGSYELKVHYSPEVLPMETSQLMIRHSGNPEQHFQEILLHGNQASVMIHSTGEYSLYAPDHFAAIITFFEPSRQKEIARRQGLFYLDLGLGLLGTICLLLSAWFSAHDRSLKLTEGIKSGEVFRSPPQSSDK